MRTLMLLMIFLVGFANVATAESPRVLMMATTTSTDNTGLLDMLAPAFTKDTGIALRWVATGTGNALKMGENCDVDVLLVHAPEAEMAFVESGFGVDRSQVMYNDFVIIGPASDPVGIKGLSVVEALSKLAARSGMFLSRGDNSGTHKMEKKLWKMTANTMPDTESWYVQTGQGMLQTIHIAAEKSGYTMTDRGTYIKYEASVANAPLHVLVEGDTSLFNQYSVIAVNPAHCPDAQKESADTFIHWVASPEVQKNIGDFKLLGKTMFIPNAE